MKFLRFLFDKVWASHLGRVLLIASMSAIILGIGAYFNSPWAIASGPMFFVGAFIVRMLHLNWVEFRLKEREEQEALTNKLLGITPCVCELCVAANRLQWSTPISYLQRKCTDPDIKKILPP